MSALDDRTLTIPGLVNARDLGGLPTTDSRRVRRGLVFRSESLAGLGVAGVSALAALPVHTVVDLRDASEIAANGPDSLPGPQTNYVHLEVLGDLHDGQEAGPGGPGTDSSSLDHVFIDGRAEEIMRSVYVQLAVSEPSRTAWLHMFEILADDATGPLLFHCTAGKDRTGFFAGLLLRVLGVDMALIESDYLSSNVAYEKRWPHGWETLAARVSDPAVLRPFVDVDRSYLDAAQHAIRTTYGDLEGYLADGVKVSAKTVGRLKDRLLA